MKVWDGRIYENLVYDKNHISEIRGKGNVWSGDLRGMISQGSLAAF